MSGELFIEKIQLAEVDPDKKYLIMVKVENDQYIDADHMANAGNYIMAAMERLGCKRENISITFGYAMEIVSIATDEPKMPTARISKLEKRIEELEIDKSQRENYEWEQRDRGL